MCYRPIRKLTYNLLRQKTSPIFTTALPQTFAYHIVNRSRNIRLCTSKYHQTTTPRSELRLPHHRNYSSSSAISTRGPLNTTSNQPNQPNQPDINTNNTMAAAASPIFTLPIAAYKSASHTAPEGSITVTQPAPQIYLVTITSPPDNRLTPPLLSSLRLGLDILLTTLPPGVVITTSSIPKFYSNGLDFSATVADPQFTFTSLYPVWRSLLTFPWPTVALINGHCFAGGLMMAMSHDYRIMNPHKGFLCLNELDFNAPLTPPMAGIFKAKISMGAFRTLILEGKRMNALAALEAGIIDGVGGLEETVKVIGELGLKGKLREVGVGSYGVIKEEMYRGVIGDLDLGYEGERRIKGEREGVRNRLMDEARKRVEAWKGDGGKLPDVKAKL